MDKANIYDLPENLLFKYKEDAFPEDEVIPGTKEFAQKFKTEILNMETPRVIALEGGYGIGKTYFITRFCEYLKKTNFAGDEPITAIYLNLWESDYIISPFPVIASKIISELVPGQELKESIELKAIEITNNLLKFGAKLALNADIGNVLPNLKQNKDDINAFKKDLIKLIGNKKTVLIVDELDRCKPDYAVKTLEAIKHFFDIDGLIVILTTRIDFMDSICGAYYGQPKCDLVGEGYIQKFVHWQRDLNLLSETNYAHIVNQILNKDTLPNVDDFLKKIESLNSTLAKVFFNNKISVRRAIDICHDIKAHIHQYKAKLWRNNQIWGYSERAMYDYLIKKYSFKNSDAKPPVSWHLSVSDPEEGEGFLKQDVNMLL